MIKDSWDKVSGTTKAKRHGSNTKIERRYQVDYYYQALPSYEVFCLTLLDFSYLHFDALSSLGGNRPKCFMAGRMVIWASARAGRPPSLNNLVSSFLI